MEDIMKINKKLNIGLLVLVILSFAYIILYSFNIKEYNNSVFTKERYKGLNRIIYWSGGKEIEIKNKYKIKKVYSILAKEELNKSESSGKDGHMLMDLYYGDDVVKLGILDGELGVDSEDKEVNGFYTTNNNLCEGIRNILE